jgi:hypothetical protein
MHRGWARCEVLARGREPGEDIKSEDARPYNRTLLALSRPHEK